MRDKENTTAGKREQEVRWRWWDNYQGQVEGNAHVQPDAGGKGNLPLILSAMEDMLWEQHAVREQIEYAVFEFPIIIKTGSDYAVQQEPPWDSDTTTRPRGFLQCRIRELLAEAFKAEPELADFRIHAQRTELENWLSNSEAKRGGSVDTLERRRRTDVCQCGRRGYNMPGADGEDSRVHDMRAMLEYDPAN